LWGGKQTINVGWKKYMETQFSKADSQFKGEVNFEKKKIEKGIIYKNEQWRRPPRGHVDDGGTQRVFD